MSGVTGEFYIICYDSPSNKRRRKLHKLLKNYAVAVQKSVFETFLDAQNFTKMMNKIEKLMNEKEDSVRVYGMSKRIQRKVKIIGFPGLLLDPNHYFIEGEGVGDELWVGREDDEDLPDWI